MGRYLETTEQVRAWFDICAQIIADHTEDRAALESAAEALGITQKALYNKLTAQAPYHKAAPPLSAQEALLKAFGYKPRFLINGMPYIVGKIDGLFFDAILAQYGSFGKAYRADDVFGPASNTKNRNCEKSAATLHAWGQNLGICIEVEFGQHRAWVLGDYTAEQKEALNELHNQYNNF